MKKLLFSLFAIAMTAGVATAGQDISKEDVRIYIDPGHGGFGSDDRHMTTINTHANDTLDFWETTTNLWKGLKCRQELIDNGVPAANIKMSRVKNGDDYNISLTARSEGANAFGADYFLSIHSDAGTTNHTLIIYNGYTTPQMDAENMYEGSRSLEYQETSRAMAETMWPYISSNGIDVFPSRSPYICGDFNFYYGWSSPAQNTGKAGYLGVLRVNTCNGFLCEGYSHQYIPATQRAMNPDYCRQEGVRYARGIGAWFGWDMDTKGDIMGSVKSLRERIKIAMYNYLQGSIDQWLPLNDIQVVLYKGGEKIATYEGDDEWNGVFVFEGLEPGDDYTIEAVAPGYKTNFALDEEYGRAHETYTVTANETTYPVIYLEATDYEPAPCYNYPNPGHEAWQKISDKYEMRQDFVNKTIAALEGKTIRREIAHGDSIYVLAHDADKKPYIYIVNALTQELYGEISTEGVGDANDERELMTISDIAFTSDSILVACNLEHMSFVEVGKADGTFRVYKWAKDDITRTPTGNPELWFTDTTNEACGNYSNSTTGQSLAISGRFEDCKIITTAKTQSSTGIRFPIFTITRKGCIGAMRNQSSDITTATIGEDYQIVISPRDDNAFVIDGSNTTPVEYALNYTATASAPTKVGAMSADLVAAGVTGANYFMYANSAVMVTPKLNAEGKVTGVAMIDVQNGFDKAVLIETTNTDIAAADCVYTMASSHVEGDDITLYLNNGNAVSRFTTLDVEQKSYNNVYAYALHVAITDNDYTFAFKANEDCENGGRLLFYDVTSGDYVGEIALDNVKAGVNSKVVAATELPGTAGQELYWSVEVSSHKVTHIKALVNRDDFKYTRAFVTADKSPLSSKHGTIYVSHYAGINKAASGVCEIDQNLNAVNSTAYNGGTNFYKNQSIACDPFGNVYVADWGVARSGLWTADAMLINDGFSQFFGGTLQADGTFTSGDAQVGGITSSVDFYGTGADAKMYAYQATADGKYVINVYNVGKEDGTLVSQWDAVPSKVIELPAGMTADASIQVVEQGVWVAQTVANATANTETSPAYMFIDNDGNITFNSATSDMLGSINLGSAIAVNKDASVLVTNTSSVFNFYNVTWEGSTPSMTLAYTYTHNIGIGSTKNADGDYVEQMTFDYAGRLVAAGRYLGVFTIPTDNNTCETPGRVHVTVGQAAVAVERVEVDANAPVEYYNLQGVKVANPEKGIFIKKQGTRTTKVVL